jgi:hypothetical protein
MKKILLPLISALLLFITLAFNGCASQTTSEGFAIYLTKDDIAVSDMEKLSHVDLADTPLVSIDDVISYNKETHEIELTPEAYERVMQPTVSVFGKSFIVCVDKQPVYWGALWTSLSSVPFSGIIINVQPVTIEHPDNIIKLELGYPTPDYYQGEDPRSNPEIMQSLEQAGKLK